MDGIRRLVRKPDTSAPPVFPRQGGADRGLLPAWRRAAELIAAASELDGRRLVLHSRSRELIGTSRKLRHACQVQRARHEVARSRRQGSWLDVPAWFAVEGVLDGQVVRACWAQGQLTCDRALRERAMLLVDLGDELTTDDPPRRFVASLQAPAIAVALTLMRACDRVLAVTLDAPALR
jgi:hypothetical protein